MSFDAIWSIAVLAVGLLVLIGEWLPTGITGLLMIVALVAPGVLTPEQAFAGLVDPAVVGVGGMFVISAGIQRTGAITYVANLFTSSRRSPAVAYVALLIVVMVLSAFMNNTPIVLVFLPVVLGLTGRMGEAPSKLLMPLSFLSILGGMCTLVGTSTNLVVAGALAKASAGTMHLGMFDFTPLGAILAVVGALFVLLARRRLLPDRVSLARLTGKGIASEYMTEIKVTAGSRSVGQTVGAMLGLDTESRELRLLQLVRDEVIQAARPDTVLAAGDIVLVKGDPTAIMAARRRAGALDGADDPAAASDELSASDQTLFEVIVPPNSRLLGRRIKNIKFRGNYHASVFAVQRRGEHHRRQVADLRLKVGDVLLVQGSQRSLDELKRGSELIVVEGVNEAIPHTGRAPVALLAMAVFVLLAVTGLQSIAIAALIAALMMVLGRCLSSSEAYAAMSWDVLFLIAGTLAVGEAFRTTGLATDCARLIAEGCGPLGHRVCLFGVFTFTTCLTQVLSNNAAAAMMTPLAYETGLALPDIGPMPFVMAVAFGSSCAFLTPIAYQTNLLIHGPGGYRFADFGRLGLPLTLILIALATALLPVMY